MSIQKIKQLVAKCDNPACEEICRIDSLDLPTFRKQLKDTGWQISRKHSFCPECAKSPRLVNRCMGKAADVKPVVLSTANVRNVICNEWGAFELFLPVDADPAEIKGQIPHSYRTEDILYVREAWAPATMTEDYYENGEAVSEEIYSGLVYRADMEYLFPDYPTNHDPEFYLATCKQDGVWRSPTNMPRHAARFFLKVLGTRFCKFYRGKPYFSECLESAALFNWNDVPWSEGITVERCAEPATFRKSTTIK